MAKTKKVARRQRATAAQLRNAKPCRECGKAPKDCHYSSSRIALHDWICAERRRAANAKRVSRSVWLSQDHEFRAPCNSLSALNQSARSSP